MVARLVCVQSRLRGCLRRGAGSSTPRESRQGVFHSSVHGQILVCLRRFACLVAWTSLLSEQMARMSQARRWLQHPKGPRLWGCLRRFACFGGHTILLSEQIVRMSQARRWFQHPKGEPPGGMTLPRSRPDCGDASSGTLVFAPLAPLLSEPHDHRDVAGVTFRHPKEARGAATVARYGPDSGDVSGATAVLTPPTLFCFRAT